MRMKGSHTAFIRAVLDGIDGKVDLVLDNGTSQSGIDRKCSLALRFDAKPYPFPRKLRLLDGSKASQPITHYITVRISKGNLGPFEIELALYDIESGGIVLGLDFLVRFGARMDFEDMTLGFSSSRAREFKPERSEQDRAEVCLLGRKGTILNEESVEYRDPVLKALVEAEEEEPDWDMTEVCEKVPKAYHAFLDLFKPSHSERLPPLREGFDHAINLIDPHKLRKARVYPMSHKQDQWLQAHLEEGVRKGHYEPSNHWFGSPVFLIPKKNGEFRLVTDFRELNKQTVKDIYPLPRITTLLERLRTATLFSKFDMPTSYQLLRVRPGDEKWSTILTRYGAFKCNVMREGMSNAGASFQRFLNELFHDLLDQGVIVYIDDILVYSADENHHVRTIQSVFARLRKAGLYLKLSKCEFHQEKIEFLGFIVRNGAIEMEEGKLDAVKSWPVPKTVKEIQKFLGFANFYRRFIFNFSGVAGPMTKLTRASTAWNWDSSAEASFQGLKRAFTEAPILRQFDPDRPCTIETDASDYAIAAVASQRFTDPDGTEHLRPVGFFSRKLKPAELNYTVHDKELLAIVDAFAHWKPNLLENKHAIEVLTDHRNLEHFRDNKQLNRRQIRWAETLQDYYFRIRYRPGTRGSKPDALTRRPDYHPGRGATKDREFNPSNFTSLLPADLFVNGRSGVLEEGESTEGDESASFLELVIEGYGYDEEAKEVLREYYQVIPIGATHGRILDGSFWGVSGGFWRKGALLVPEYLDLRKRVLQGRHDSVLIGHPGRDKTIELVERDFYWSGLKRFVAEYVQSCAECQRNKSKKHKPYGMLHSLPVPKLPWAEISMDFVEQLPISEGFDSILVVADRFTKEARFIATKGTMTSTDLCQTVLKEVISKTGLPDSVTSDRGKLFVSKFFRELLRLLKIETRFSTPYHPQTDGNTERINQSLEGYLRTYCGWNQDDWVRLLPLAEFTYNNSVHTSTKTTPFFANHGYHPRFDAANELGSAISPLAVQKVVEMDKLWRELELWLEKANARTALYYNARHRSEPDLSVGKRALVDANFIAHYRKTHKLSPKFVGPWKIVEKVGPLAYRLELPKQVKRHDVFHVSQLEPFCESTDTSRSAQPGALPEEFGTDTYEIEDIIDSRRRKGRLEYKVRWKGYVGPEALEWIDADEIDAEDTVMDFILLNPTKPRPSELPAPAKTRVVYEKTPRMVKRGGEGNGTD